MSFLNSKLKYVLFINDLFSSGSFFIVWVFFFNTVCPFFIFTKSSLIFCLLKAHSLFFKDLSLEYFIIFVMKFYGVVYEDFYLHAWSQSMQNLTPKEYFSQISNSVKINCYGIAIENVVITFSTERYILIFLVPFFTHSFQEIVIKCSLCVSYCAVSTGEYRQTGLVNFEFRLWGRWQTLIKSHK